MPTRKEASKLKADFIAKRDKAINSKINQLQSDIYESVVPDFIALAKSEELKKTAQDARQLNILQNEIKKGMASGFPDIMRETVRAARSVGDLNQMYFSTLVESDRLDDIRDKTAKIVNRNLGIDENGKILKNGFVDKTLRTEKVQKEFIIEVKKLVASNADIQVLTTRLKALIVGSPERNGIINSYYNTFASTLLKNIDRSNSAVYADDLGLNYFLVTGGLIKTTRQFCLQKNGKIFSREQAEKWKDDPFIRKVYGKKISQYDPLTDVGGPNCIHSLDWITDELAKGNIREQNARARERNEKFKERHNL